MPDCNDSYDHPHSDHHLSSWDIDAPRAPVKLGRGGMIGLFIGGVFCFALVVFLSYKQHVDVVIRHIPPHQVPWADLSVIPALLGLYCFIHGCVVAVRLNSRPGWAEDFKDWGAKSGGL